MQLHETGTQFGRHPRRSSGSQRPGNRRRRPAGQIAASARERAGHPIGRDAILNRSPEQAQASNSDGKWVTELFHPAASPPQFTSANRGAGGSRSPFPAVPFRVAGPESVFSSRRPVSVVDTTLCVRHSLSTTAIAVGPALRGFSTRSGNHRPGATRSGRLVGGGDGVVPDW
jgi:hypothetical protein